MTALLWIERSLGKPIPEDGAFDHEMAEIHPAVSELATLIIPRIRASTANIQC